MQATNLRRNFGSFTAVDGVDLVLRSGVITGLVGPNGAGKTTLMLMLAGMLSADTGEISVLGENCSVHPRAARAHIGWLPDSCGSWGSLTVKEIMVDFGKLHGLNKSAASSRADELLTRVHLDAMAQSAAHVLSRGQKQRLGVARTLIHQPAVLILDEPAAGMDPRSRIDLRALVRAQADRGAAVLISSHVLSELETLVDDVLFMEAGKIVHASVHSSRAGLDAEPGTGSGIKSRIELGSESGAGYGVEFPAEPGADPAVGPGAGAESGAEPAAGYGAGAHSSAPAMLRYRMCTLNDTEERDGDEERVKALLAEAGICGATGKRDGAGVDKHLRNEYEILVSSEVQAAQLLSRLVAAGVHVAAFAPIRTSLEDIYMRLEGGE